MTTLATAEPRRRRLKPRGTTSRAERAWLLWPPLVFFVVMLGVPIAMLFISSFTTGGEAWGATLTNSVFIASVIRTVVMAVIVTALAVILGGIYALGIWAAPRWLAGIFVGLLFLSLWTSTLVRSISWMLLEIPKGAIYWFLNLLGLAQEPIELYQTAVAMYPAMLAITMPYVVLPVMTALSGVDREQLNAAVVFGARPGLVFRTVIYPQMAPQLISGGVLVFVMALGFYVTPLVLGGPQNLTVSGVINTQISSLGHIDIGSVMSLLLVAATIVIYLIADRLFRVSEKWG